MPTIRVPPLVTIRFPNADGTEREVPFEFAKHFVTGHLLNDVAFGRDAKSVIAAAEIEAVFTGASPGSSVPLTQDQYDRLKAAAETPSQPFQPLIMRQAVSYLRAVIYPTEAA